MTRLANISILFSISAIAASCGTVMVYLFARPVGEAITVSLTAMCTMIFIHFMLTRSQEKSAMSDAVDRLEERIAVIDDDVGNLEGRLTGVEHNIPRRTREEIDPLFAEVEVIGSLVKQMAEAWPTWKPGSRIRASPLRTSASSKPSSSRNQHSACLPRKRQENRQRVV